VIFLTGLIWNPAEFLTSEKFPALRLWEFMLGMFIEPYVKKFHFNFRYGSIIALVLIFLGPFVGAYIGSLTRWDFAKWMSMSAISLVFICILCMGDLTFSSGRLLASKVFIIGGEISYSLYLIHDSIQRYSRVALEYFTGLSLQSMSWQIKLSYLAATTLLSLIASYALWKIVELPCRRFLRDFLSKKKLSSPSHLS